MEQKINVANVFRGKRAKSNYTLVDARELEELIDSRANVEAFIMTFKKVLGYVALVAIGIALGVVFL
nr:hypothetical protein [uncultured Lachnoanaerobaculum sp.]